MIFLWLLSNNQIIVKEFLKFLNFINIKKNSLKGKFQKNYFRNFYSPEFLGYVSNMLDWKHNRLSSISPYCAMSFLKLIKQIFQEFFE